MNYLSSINGGLHKAMEEYPNAVIIGEDILDPYGGAFKVSKGLSQKYPERVFSTPISEAGFVGLATGMAMRGMLPIVEIMFGDFTALIINQILNHGSKYRGMYNNKVTVPLLVRSPMGGGRGYGPTHSQSLEKMFLGIPGINLICPSVYHNPQKLLLNILSREIKPTIFIENKLLYPVELSNPENMNGNWRGYSNGKDYDTVVLSNNEFESCDLTIITYGANVEIAINACNELLYEDELTAEIIVISDLKNLPLDIIESSLSRSRTAVTIEEGGYKGGLGAEYSSIIHENCFHLLSRPVLRIASYDFPIPNSKPLEDEILVNPRMVVSMVRKTMLK